MAVRQAVALVPNPAMSLLGTLVNPELASSVPKHYTRSGGSESWQAVMKMCQAST